ncbi:sulfatase-like hydrolase/transferase [Paenibacillus sp. PFR10]|uniref:Sulfatase-like hydrolase/transferase n=1 Tax=Paenibacillus violae TaxID=3077234 RepID=A0ABU3RGG1_9BACL|nr:sulfatase-like hydrolase/transferase [Paenibacillus sp. PFR10]MDU0203324.1 sulfatase-like hydrolase/transferase [Paenibacillus sp. PFR10]
MSQPNIVVICSDQHHPLITGYREHPYIQTPNLDQLAAEGTYFSRAYSNCPVCTPSRMSFVTGKYPNQIDSWFLGCPLDREEMTWARKLDQAGIPSAMFGKMDFCGDYQDGGFSEYKIIKKRPAFNPYPRATPLYSRLEGHVREDKRKTILNAGICEDVVTDGNTGYDKDLGFYDHDRVVTDWAIDYLKRKGKNEEQKPWAMYVGLMFPHWPYRVPKPYYDKYYPDNVVMPHDAHFPNDRLHPQVRNMQNALGLGEITEPDLRNLLASYYGMITALDDNIGRIIAELKAQNLYDNTYIVYMSDHGENLGEHGLFFKQCSYEASVGVPLIVKGPGLPSGQRIDQPVTLVDLYPTLMDIAGLETEPDRPGMSWLPLIKDGRQQGRHDYAFSEYHGNFFKQDWYMLVKDGYKFTYYVNDRPSLFNLEEDPQEMTDLAGEESYRELLHQFEVLLREIVDPEAVSLRAKRDLGLIGSNGEDYTLTLTDPACKEWIKQGIFQDEAEFPKWEGQEGILQKGGV